MSKKFKSNPLRAKIRTIPGQRGFHDTGEKKSKQINLRVTETELESIDRYCKKHGHDNKSLWIRELIFFHIT